jgi:predicted nucleic acid-binding protein
LSACVLDSDVVIAALDRSDAHHVPAARAVIEMTEAGIELVLSTVNYAETLVRPAGDERALRTAIESIRALRVRLVAPSASVAVEAARLRSLGVSLPDGFALATAKAEHASVASFDRRVRRALERTGVELAPQLA